MELLECVASVEDVDDLVERLGTIGEDHGVTVQAFDARYVVDRTHLERALARADRAIERGENVAHDRAVEVLCYAAGRRQINRALEIGVSEGQCPTVILVAAPPDDVDGETSGESEDSAGNAKRAALDELESMPELRHESTLGEYDPERVQDYFDVSAAELATVDGDIASLVYERVALLDVEK